MLYPSAKVTNTQRESTPIRNRLTG
jgi:hypothetical protein